MEKDPNLPSSTSTHPLKYPPCVSLYQPLCRYWKRKMTATSTLAITKFLITIEENAGFLLFREVISKTRLSSNQAHLPQKVRCKHQLRSPPSSWPPGNINAYARDVFNFLHFIYSLPGPDIATKLSDIEPQFRPCNKIRELDEQKELCSKAKVAYLAALPQLCLVLVSRKL